MQELKRGILLMSYGIKFTKAQYPMTQGEEDHMNKIP